MAVNSIRWHYSSLDQMIVPIAGLLEMTAEVLAGEVRKKISRFGPRSGRRYKVPGRKVKYTASAPGEPPARANGDLVTKISRSNAHNKGNGVWAVEVGTNANANGTAYASILESGSSKIKPRPAWLVTLEDPKVKRMMLNIFANKALRRKASGA